MRVQHATVRGRRHHGFLLPADAFAGGLWSHESPDPRQRNHPPADAAAATVDHSVARATFIVVFAVLQSSVAGGLWLHVQQPFALPFDEPALGFEMRPTV